MTGIRVGNKIPLSVFFPCYNEVGNIARMVADAQRVIPEVSDDYEIIIVNDGSTDGSRELLDDLAGRHEDVKVVHHPTNKGYGSALRSGFEAATKEYVFYTDGDCQFDLSELVGVVELMTTIEGGCDIVSCYRSNRSEGFIRKFNAVCWSALIGFMFNMPGKDVDCAFKLYKREIFDTFELKSTGALIDTEILARAVRKGYKIIQMPVKHYPRQYGHATGANPFVILRAFYELFRLWIDIVRS
ncbi:MAG: glycosyltransferase family 2 protein [Sedimentisphaeraceae bacterium JB056]